MGECSITVEFQTNAGVKRIVKDFPTLADGESWVVKMAENPRFIKGGCDEWAMAVGTGDGYYSA